MYPSPQGDGSLTKKNKGSENLSTGAAFCFSVRDVLIASIAKGQFPVAIGGMVAISIVWRMPPADVSQFAFRLLDAAERRVIVGYLIAGVLVAAWFIHARYQRKQFEKELARVISERNSAQSQALGTRVQSSGAKP